ncbi:recombinase family protein [Paracoccus sp. NGMCC 1.201697]|uniref:Recombinase family protein n=1 Tax=Paracoccus broussonetiae subsp. drimophilus TaxID=3373869 RepID=A0ABW7LRT2_9RHOB
MAATSMSYASSGDVRTGKGSWRCWSDPRCPCLNSQQDPLRAVGAEKVFADVGTGSARHRPQLDRMLDQLREGNVVVVTKYDRLARSLRDLLELVRQVQGKRVPASLLSHPASPPH